MAQKHTEGPEGDQHDLVRSQKSGSGPTETESNCGRTMSPMGQRGLDEDDGLPLSSCCFSSLVSTEITLKVIIGIRAVFN